MIRTNFLLQGFLRLDVIFLQFVIQLLESLEVLDGDTHLLNLLPKHEIPLSELHEHLFCSQCVIKLRFEVVNLRVGVGEFDESCFVLTYCRWMYQI